MTLVRLRGRLRLFVALPVPDDPRLAAAGAAVASAVPGARPAAGHPHATLRFLGEVLDVPALESALGRAVQGRPALPAVVEGWGAFPGPKQARVLWAGVRAPGVEALAAAVQEATAPFGEPPERRSFVAHVSLARLPRPRDVRSLLASHADDLLAEGVLDRVVLYDSVAGPDGQRHVPRREWLLR